MKQHDRGRAGLRVLVALVLCVTTAAVSAQQYPSKPVRVIVPLAPGGGSDITARHFSAKLAEILGQPFIVDNRGGAGGLIGMELTAKAPPDGYTLMMQEGGVASVPATQKTAWDPLSAIIPIMEFGVTPFILTVHPSFPRHRPRSSSRSRARSPARSRTLPRASAASRISLPRSSRTWQRSK